MTVTVNGNTATFTGTGDLTGATAQLDGATIAIIVGYSSIGQQAFFGASSLTSITIPSSVTSIGPQAFRTASSLTSITFPQDSLLTSIGNYAFYSASSLTSINIPASVASIGHYAFQGASGLTTVTFEQNSSLTSIGDLAFNGATSLTEIIIPYDVIKIGTNAFNGATSLNKVTIEDGQVINTTTYNTVNGTNITDSTKYSSRATGLTNVAFFGKTVAMFVYTPPPPPAPICFPAGTPVTTDQGFVPIEQLNTDKHTIDGKEIVAITQSRPLFKEIVSIKKNALAKNIPSQYTEISKKHSVFYKGNMIEAGELVDLCAGVEFIPYNGETLYNVLLKKHSTITINNMVCETLDPNNIMAKICGGKFNTREKHRLCNELSTIIRSNDIYGYLKLEHSLM